MIINGIINLSVGVNHPFHRGKSPFISILSLFFSGLSEAF